MPWKYFFYVKAHFGWEYFWYFFEATWGKGYLEVAAGDWIVGLSDDSLRRLLKVHLKMAKQDGEVFFSPRLGRQWARIKKFQFFHLIDNPLALQRP